VSSEILGSGLAFPLQVDSRGRLALTRGEEDIEQAIKLILATAPGEREMRPEFGCAVHDLVFDTVDAAMIGKLETAIRGALDRWEPRIEVEDLDFELGGVADGRLLITISYRVRATNHARNLVYPFYVIPEEDAE
jgi:phage baseplate assembly protein W